MCLSGCAIQKKGRVWGLFLELLRDPQLLDRNRENSIVSFTCPIGEKERAFRALKLGADRCELKIIFAAAGTQGKGLDHSTFQFLI